MITEASFVSLCLSLLAAAVGVLLFVAAFARPRLLLYAILAMTPTQFLFFSVSDFFISPADVLVLAASAALVVRLLLRRTRAIAALRQHAAIGFMVLAYCVGFVALGLFSRTLARILMAVVPSVLACELIRTRRQLAIAVSALAAGGMIEAGYGLYFYATGTWLHPTRFSGMMGVNFSAFIIITSAAIGFARTGRTNRAHRLIVPALLAALGAATFSQMGALAFLAAWILVLSQVLTRHNRLLLIGTATTAIALVLAWPAARDRILARNERQVQLDGQFRNTSDVRVLALRKVWDGFAHNPVVGIGYAQFQPFSTTDPEISAGTGGQGIVTHNTYAEVLVEGGLPAFVLLLLHLRRYWRLAPLGWNAIAVRRDPLVAASLVGLPMLAVSAALLNLLLIYTAWAILGVGLAALNILRDEQARMLS